MDEQIASLSIGTGLDLTGIQRDLDRINAMTSQVKVSIGLQFDDKQASTQINRLAQTFAKTVIRPTVDHKPFEELNKHIALKDRDIKKLQQTYKNTVIKPATDEKPLVSLNQSIDLTDQKIKTVARSAKTNVIRLRVDDSALPKATIALDEFSNKFKQVSAQLNSDPMLKTLSSAATTRGTIKVEMTHKQAKDDRSAKGNADSSQELKRGFDELNKSIKASKQSPLGSVFQGIFQQFGFQISSGIQSSLKSQFDIDLRRSAKGRADSIAVPVKALFTENAELKQSIDRAGAKLDARFKEAGYKLGDAIVDALDADGATIKDRLNIIFSQAFKGGDFKKNLQQTLKEIQPEGAAAVRSVVAGSYVRGGVQSIGQNLSAYREQAIADRAVPLVLRRTAEILNQSQQNIGSVEGLTKEQLKARKEAKRAQQNQGTIVDDDTKQLFITIGGYAGMEGRSGAGLAGDLKRDKNLQNAKVIYVENKDSDIAASAIDSKPNPMLQRLGLGLGTEWVGEVAKSLAKPNIRGYSKDAVEAASQAYAAYQKNPDIEIKILGGSGGGFVAEEAVQILQQLGVKNASYLGVGTPNFMGGLNAQGQKVVSPDEGIGLLNKVASTYGLSNADQASQNVLGVEDHPYQNYRKARTAELENFLYGTPDPMSDKDIEGLKKQAIEASKTDFSKMTPKQLQETVEVVLDNYEYLRRFLISSEKEANAAIEEVAEIYKKIYLRVAKEPEQFKQVRAKIKQAEVLYGRLSNDPGAESKARADQIKKELELTRQELDNASKLFDGTLYAYVGTFAEKRDELLKNLDSSIAKYSDPSLGLKQPTPTVRPDVMGEELKIPMADLSDRSGELVLADEKPKNIVQKALDNTTTAIANKVRSDIETVREAVIDLVINKVNDQLMRVPGAPDILDPSRQIGGLDELQMGDYLKMAQIGTEDSLRGLMGGTAKAYSVAKGAENVLFGAVPPLALVKGLTQRVGLPMAAFSAAGSLPGIGAAEGAMTGVTESLLAMPAEQLATVMSGAFADAIGMTIANIPLVGGKLAPALTEAISLLLTQSAGAIAGGAAEVITPIVGGQVLLGAASQGAKSILPDLTPNQIKANKQLEAATQDRLQRMQAGMEYARAMLPVDRGRATKFLDSLKTDYPELQAGVDGGLMALPAGQRMAEGSKLAGLKGQIVKAQNAIKEAEKQITAFSNLVGNVTQSIQQFTTSARSANADVIDVDYTEVKEQKALPAAKGATDAQKLQAQLDRILQYTRKQIDDIGAEFSRQSASLQSKALPQEEKARIAASLNRLADESKSAIDDIIKTFGGSVPTEIKKSAQYAKQKITKADTKSIDAIKAAQQAGANIPEGLNEGIESRIGALRSTAQNMAQVVILAAEKELEIKSPSRVFQRIGSMVVAGYKIGLEGLNDVQKVVTQSLKPDDFTLFNQQISNAGNNPDASYEALKTAERLRYKMQQAQAQAIDPPQVKKKNPIVQFIDDIEKKIGLAQGTIAGFGDLIKRSILGFIGFNVLSQIIPLINNFANAASQSAREFDQFNQTLRFATGSGREALEIFSQLSDEANNVGFNLKQALAGRAQLEAAAKDTSAQGYVTDLLSDATNNAGAVSSLTGEQQGRAFTALSQVLGKATVQSEELKGQLAEVGGVFSNTMGITARAYGVSVQQLTAMMQRGEILSQEFAYKFGQQLQSEVSASLDDAANSAQAAMNRVENSTFQLQTAFGKAIQPGQIAVFNTFSGVLDTIGNNIDVLLNSIASIGLLLGGVLLKSLPAIVDGIAGLAIKTGLIPPTLSLTVAGAKAAGMAIGSMAAKFAVAYAAVEALQIVFELFKDQSGDLGKIAEQSSNGLDKLTESLNNAATAAKNMADATSGLRAAGKIGDLAEATRSDPFMGQDSAYAQANRINQERLSNIPVVGGALSSAFEFINKPIPDMLNEYQVDRQLKAYNESIDKITSSSQELMQKSQQFLTDSNGSLQQMRQITDAIEENQARQRSLRINNPGDVQGLKELQKQEAELIEKRGQYSQQSGAIQSQQQAQIDRVKEAIEAWDALYKNRNINESQYNSRLKELKSTLAQLEANQVEFNQAIGDGALRLGQLAKQLENIADTLADAKENADIASNFRRSNIAQMEIRGSLTPGQSQAGTDASNQQGLQQQLNALNSAIQQYTAILQDQQTRRTLEIMGIDDPESLGSAEISRLKQRYEGNPAETRALDTLAGLRQARIETTQVQAQLDEARLQAQRSIVDAGKQVADFMRSTARSIQEIGLTIERANLDTQIQQVKNDLQENLSGFSDRFFGQFLSGVMELIDVMNEPLQRMIDARGQVAGLQNQYADMQLQGGQLGRSVYGGMNTGGGVPGQPINTGAYQVHTQYLYDESPPGSYDFTIEQNGNFNPSIPSPVSGVVTDAVTGHNGYGNFVTVQDFETGQEWLIAHMHELAVQAGQTVTEGMSLGLQGTTGSSTGEHIHAEIWDKPYSQGGQQIRDRSITEPLVRDWIAQLEAGVFTPTMPAQQPSSIAPSAPQQTPSAFSSVGQGMQGVDLFSGGSDSIAARIIGISEGTRTADGGKTVHYGGHIDPGNAAHNMGSFSYQHGAGSPEEADRRWNEQLASVFPDFIAAATSAGLDPNNPLLALSFSDLYTQSPLAATDRGGFLSRLPEIAAAGATPESIVQARVNSYYNPDTGALEAWTDLAGLTADQQRRTNAVLEGLQANGLAAGGSIGSFAPSYGQPSVDTSMINSGVSQFGSAISQQTNAILQQVEAQDRATAIRLRQGMEARQRELEDAQRTIEEEARQYNERYQDSILAAFGDSPIANTLTQLTQATRESESTLRQQELTLRDAEVSLENLKSLRQEITTNEGLAPLRELIPGMDETIATYETQIEEIRVATDREQQILSDRQNAILQGLRDQQSQAMRQLDQQNESLRQNQQLQSIRDPELQQLAQFRSQRGQIVAQYEEQIRSLNLEIENTIKGIERLTTEGFAVDSTDVVVANEQLAGLQEQLAQIEANKTIELNITSTEQLRAIQDFQRQQQDAIVQGQAGIMAGSYNQFGANRLQRNYAGQQENLRYQEQLNSINALETQMMGQEGFDATVFERMRSDAEALNQINLEGFRQQFQSVGDSINTIAIDGLGSLSNSLSAVIFDGKSLESVFDEVSRSIIDSLLSIGTQLLQGELYNLFFPSQKQQSGGIGGMLGGLMGGAAPGGGSGGGGGLGGLIGGLFGGGGGAGGGILGVLGGLIGFNNGGLIPGQYTGSPDRTLARVNPGEFIMKRSAVAYHGVPKLSAMNNLRRFNDGGFVDYSNTRSYRDYAGENAGRSTESSGAIEVKVQTEMINQVEYVRKDQFEDGMKKAADEGAKRGEERVRRGMSQNPSYRRGLGVS